MGSEREIQGNPEIHTLMSCRGRTSDKDGYVFRVKNRILMLTAGNTYTERRLLGWEGLFRKGISLSQRAGWRVVGNERDTSGSEGEDSE